MTAIKSLGMCRSLCKYSGCLSASSSQIKRKRIVAKSIQPLSNFQVLATADVDASRAAMASIYGDVTLNPVGRNSLGASLGSDSGFGIAAEVSGC